jgi:glycosyltransferase involved in cell wall biosynthesis
MDVVTPAPTGRSLRQPLRRPATPRHSHRSHRNAGEAMRIAMLAPPWISIPAPGYGGVESVVNTLTDALVGRGHEVTLFCAPGSVSPATVVTVLADSHPDEIERALYEADHVAQVFDQIDGASGGDRRFDVIHDHCGFTGLAMAGRIDTPLVHTLHGPFTPQTAAFYARHGHKATLVGISHAQLASAPDGLTISSIPNPIDLAAWPLQERKDDYLLWIGRITPEKGPHRAIAAARSVDVPLILAGVIQPGQQAYFDGVRVQFVGEVSGATKRSLFARARGLLMPIRWDEPFGMVIVEALACGTPVIAFPEGAARDLVLHGKTGFLVNDEGAMADAIGRLPQIAPRDCRAWVSRHCDIEVVATAYEAVYRRAARTALQPLIDG